ncbi:NAD-dependent epimerase/dehydratase family protein [Candidatus Dojkabacteria bacterium]|nr:NAD-dependent epimerase/dehydratase family protein [Candidatus Dojkabacteria bacterium]
MKRKKVFVTGATGFLGSNLVKKLVSEGYETSVLLRKESKHPFLNLSKVRVVYGNLFEPKSYSDSFKDIDVIFHVAGKVSYSKFDKKLVRDLNIKATENILREAYKNKVAKFILTSSTAAVGIPRPKEIADEKYPFFSKYKKIPYLNSKRLAEKIALDYNRKGLKVVAVSPSTIMGAGDINMNVGEIYNKVKNSRILVAPEGGNSIIGVKDCVEGHLKAMKYGKPGEKYILTGMRVTNKELMNKIAEYFDGQRVRFVIPREIAPLLKFFAGILENIFQSKIVNPAIVEIAFSYRYFSSKKAQKELNWEPRQNLDDIIKEAILFYKKHELVQ